MILEYDFQSTIESTFLHTVQSQTLILGAFSQNKWTEHHLDKKIQLSLSNQVSFEEA